MKKKILAIILVAVFAIGIVPLVRSDDVDAAVCNHNWLPVLKNAGEVPSGYVAPRDGYYDSKYAIHCRCGEWFASYDQLREHMDKDINNETCWSWGSAGDTLVHVYAGTIFEGGATKYDVIGYRCEYCGELK